MVFVKFDIERFMAGFGTDDSPSAASFDVDPTGTIKSFMIFTVDCASFVTTSDSSSRSSRKPLSSSIVYIPSDNVII
jgi:hypothetical protein